MSAGFDSGYTAPPLLCPTTAMITLQQLEKLRLHRRPAGQLVMANLVLSWDYLLPRRTRIVLEGSDNLPRESAYISPAGMPAAWLSAVVSM